MGKRNCAPGIPRYPLAFQILLLLFLVACTILTPPTPTPPLDPSRLPVTLTLWHTQSGPARTQLNAFAVDFQKAHPWITIRIEAKNSEGDLIKQGIAAAALNQTPDVIIAGVRAVADLARRGDLVPLDLFIDDPTFGLSMQDQADFLPGSLQIGRFPGARPGLFSLPFNERAVVLYYNADALREARVPIPPRTWDEFDDAARSTTQGNVRGWVMVPDANVFYAWIYGHGGSVLDDRQAAVQFNDEAGSAVLEEITALTRGGAAYLVDQAAAARSDFAQGKTALLFGTTDDLSSVAAAVNQAGNRFQWGVAHIPQTDPRRAWTALLGDRLAIFRSVPEHERAAWRLLRWLTSPEQAARWSRTATVLPARLGARAFLVDSGSAGPAPISVANLIDPLPTGRGVPTVKDASAIDQALVEMWTAVANGTAPATALARAVTRVRLVLGQTP